MTATWKRGRGTLGPLAPLLGHWIAETDSAMGPVRVARSLVPFGKKWVEMRVVWDFAEKSYEEIAMLGAGEDGRLAFWSYTSDGKASHGVAVDAPDVHPQAVAFEAEMGAGTARMVFWPAEDVGVRWAVEARTKKGWSRFTEHHYRPAPSAGGR